MNEPSARIDPFPTPNFLSVDPSTSASFDFAYAYPVIFALVFGLWLAYTLIVTYHWLRYGHKSFLAVPMLATHIVVSGMLFLMTTAGLR